MAEERMRRDLAAAAVGCSRLVDQDEQETLDRFRAHRERRLDR